MFSKSFSIQGHRGARGLLPENTIESCCKAVALGVDGLEIDVVVSKDRQLPKQRLCNTIRLYFRATNRVHHDALERKKILKKPCVFAVNLSKIKKNVKCFSRHIEINIFANQHQIFIS